MNSGVCLGCVKPQVAGFQNKRQTCLTKNGHNARANFQINTFQTPCSGRFCAGVRRGRLSKPVLASAASSELQTLARPAPPAPSTDNLPNVPDCIRLPLPALKQEFLPISTNPTMPATAYPAAGAQVRKCVARVYPPAVVPGVKRTHAIIFGHGFSQPPENYESYIKSFQAQGWLVVAPTTNISQILFPWQPVETTGFTTKLPTKLQTGLILDMIRSAQYIKEDFFQTEGKDLPPLGEIAVCGHSMGAACSLVIASYLKQTAAVGVMAPAVKATTSSPVNQLLHLGGSYEDTDDAVQLFRDQIPEDMQVFIVGANQDLVVPKAEVQGLFAALDAGRKQDLSHADYFPIDGGHIGFEDKVDIDVDVFGFWQKLLFKIVNYLVYQEEILNWNGKMNFGVQRSLARLILINKFAATVGSEVVPLPALEPLPAGSKIDGRVVPLTEAELKALEDEQVPADLQAWVQAQIPVAGPADAPWQLQTGLLVGYAAVHALSLFTTLPLLADHVANNGVDWTTAGLAIISGLAAGLVYENLILAAGRFIVPDIRDKQRRRLLGWLNQPRFFFHSAAPALQIAGVNLASRAGVGFASSPAYIGVVTALTLGVVFLSTFRNTFLLETRPQWSGGILHFTYNDRKADFTRVVPVAFTTFFLTILGFASARQEPSLLPMGVGAAACLALSAGVIPKKVAPMIMTGNFGEVLLLASLAYTQVTERGLGL